MGSEADGLPHRIGVLDLSGEGHVQRRPGDVVLDADVDVLAATGALAVEEGGQRTGRTLTAAVTVGKVGADTHGRAVGVAVDVQESAESLQRQIGGGELAVWSGLAEGRDRGENDAGVDRRELGVAEAEDSR